ncbi:triple tyrosine motif-containing protein [Flavihumibacter stibioxidans]|uniref:Histidine kinase domain-containing protein n=1 Tax=Flavihumibacter stibioxidans TaxID=1834163 RepID=A0ABR7M8K1_9BACT|nr:sensor histidine kinase [Flavihumibacter stibioxidans]MBC6491359.1 hypothetical protein [Flavihumibacter stibioxidans]
MQGRQTYFASLMTLLILCAGAGAQAQSGGLLFKNITIEEGLSQNSVVDITTDHTGFLWMATQDGLNRFDGNSFIHFDIRFDDITEPRRNRLGRILANGNDLWMIANGGRLLRLNLLTYQVKEFHTIGRDSLVLPALSHFVVDSKQRLWLSSWTEGLFRVDSSLSLVEHFTADAGSKIRLNSNQIQHLYVDGSNQVWVLTDNGINVIQEDRVKYFLPGIHAASMDIDHAGNVWIGTLGEGLFVKNVTHDNFHHYEDLPGGGKNLVIPAVYADSLYRIWVGTYGEGLFVINNKEGVIQHQKADIRNPFALAFNDVLSIRADHQYGIWIGTDGGGASLYNEQLNNFHLVSTANTPGHLAVSQVRAITTDRLGNTWIGTSGMGYTKWNTSLRPSATYHLRPYKPGISNYDRVVSLMSDEQHQLWIGTQGNGLLIKDGSTQATVKWFHTDKQSGEFIPDNTIWQILDDGNGKAWVATRNGGIFLLDKQKGVQRSFQFAPGKDSSLASNNVRCFVRLNDSLFCIGLEEKGIQLFNLKSGKFYRPDLEDKWHALRDQEGIKSMLYKDGWLWAGTAGHGLLVFSPVTGKLIQISGEQGLPNNMIYGIQPDKGNAVWVSTNLGLAKITYTISGGGLGFQNLYHFTVSDGLQSNEFNTGASHMASDGTLYFGGIKGFNFFHPGSINLSAYSTPVAITGATVNNNPIISDTLITYKKLIQLNHRDNSLAFSFAALEMISPDKLKYEYQLVGYDEDWVQSGARGFASYTNLLPGSYLFRVRASAYPGQEAFINGIEIFIDSPFWKKKWFLLLSILSGALVLYGLHRYRLHQQLRVYKMRNDISYDLHDDIGSRLTSIQLLGALARNGNPVKPAGQDYLARLNDEVQSAAEALNEIVWNMKVNDESTEELVSRLRKYCGEWMEQDEIAFSFLSDDTIRGKRLSIKKRRDVFMAFKEMLNNVKKHAGASQVDIRIDGTDNIFSITVRDNGVGMVTDGNDRNGIRILKERAQRWNGFFTIQSEIAGGTTAVFSLPFNRKKLFNS